MDKSASTRRNLEIIDTIIILVLIGVSVISVLNYNQVKSEISNTVTVYGLVAIFLLIFFLELVPQFLDPTLVTVAGIISGLGFHQVIIVSIVSSLLGSIAGFWLGEKYGYEHFRVFFKPDTMKKVLNFWNKYGKAFVIVGALLPLPYFPIIYGALKMRNWDFFLYGLIPRAVNFLIFGYGFYYGLWNLV